MPNTTSKKTEKPIGDVDKKLLEMETKNKELEDKMDKILVLLQGLSPASNAEKPNVSSENKVFVKEDFDTPPDEPLANKNIKVTSLCYGSLNLSDGQRTALKFTKFGQTKTCLYSTLTSIVNNNTSFAENGKFYICDKSAVYYLGLQEAYSNIFNADVISNICDYSVESIKDILSKMNDTQKTTLTQILVSRMGDGEVFDLNKIEIISKYLKVNINDEIAQYKSLMAILGGK